MRGADLDRVDLKFLVARRAAGAEAQLDRIQPEDIGVSQAHVFPHRGLYAIDPEHLHAVAVSRRIELNEELDPVPLVRPEHDRALIRGLTDLVTEPAVADDAIRFGRHPRVIGIEPKRAGIADLLGDDGGLEEVGSVWTQ